MSNITFDELGLRNFLSYGNNETIVPLNFREPVLIAGVNHDTSKDGQIDTNGAGKSTILNGICFALYDTTIGNRLTKEQLINNVNEKNLEVYVSFHIGNMYYKIVRYRKHAVYGGDGVMIFEREGPGEFLKEHEKAPDSIANSNAYIAQILGYPFDVFSRVIVFSAKLEPFLSLPTTSTTKTNQSDVVEELCGHTVISKKADILKEEMKKSKRELDELIEHNQRILAERERHEGLIASTKSRIDAWTKTNREAWDATNTKLGLLAGIDFAKQQELFSDLEKVNAELVNITASIKDTSQTIDQNKSKLEKFLSWRGLHINQLSVLKSSIAVYDGVDFLEDEATLNVVEKSKRKLEEMSQLLVTNENIVEACNIRIAKLEKELLVLQDHKCPYCLQDFADGESKRVEIKTSIEGERARIEASETENQKVRPKHQKLADSVTELRSTLKYHTLVEIASHKTKKEALQSQLDQKKVETNPYEIDDVDAFKTSLEESSILLQNLQKTQVELAGKKSSITSCLQYPSLRELLAKQNEIAALEIERDRLDKETNPHFDTLDELNAIVLDKTKGDEIDVLNDLIEHQTFLHKLLTKKDSFIRKALLQKSLPFLNARIRHYLDLIGLPHKVLFTENMTAEISQLGKSLGFGQMSGGQEARINIALAFAFRDLLQARHGRVNLCVLDEILDIGLSNVGIMLTVKMIKSVAAIDQLSMFVITHRDEAASMFDQKIEVELRNAFSTINGLDTIK